MRESNIKRVKNYSKREQDGNLFISSMTARAHTRKRRLGKGCTCTYDEAGDAAHEIIAGAFGNMPQSRTAPYRTVWCWYCRHYDRQTIIDKAYQYATFERNGEVRNAAAAFQHWLQKTFGAKPSCI